MSDMTMFIMMAGIFIGATVVAAIIMRDISRTD